MYHSYLKSHLRDGKTPKPLSIDKKRGALDPAVNSQVAPIERLTLLI